MSESSSAIKRYGNRYSDKLYPNTCCLFLDAYCVGKHQILCKSSKFLEFLLASYGIFRKISYLCPRIKAFFAYCKIQKRAEVRSFPYCYLYNIGKRPTSWFSIKVQFRASYFIKLLDFGLSQGRVSAVSIKCVVICSKFITFAVTKTTSLFTEKVSALLWFAQNSLPLRWQRQRSTTRSYRSICCDLLKIHYLCGDKDNARSELKWTRTVVICSKFITFAVTKTTRSDMYLLVMMLWFAQNSLPLRWQRQRPCVIGQKTRRCDLLKIHYLCGDKDN